MKPIDVVGALEWLDNWKETVEYKANYNRNRDSRLYWTGILEAIEAIEKRLPLAAIRSGEVVVGNPDWVLHVVFSVIHEHYPEYKEVDVDIRNEIAQQIREKLQCRKEEK